MSDDPVKITISIDAKAIAKAVTSEVLAAARAPRFLSGGPIVAPPISREEAEDGVGRLEVIATIPPRSTATGFTTTYEGILESYDRVTDTIGIRLQFHPYPDIVVGRGYARRK